MPTAFETALEDTLHIEGEFSDDAADSGGATRFGITEATARQHGYTGEMDELPLSFARKIYRASYWDQLLLDKVASIAGEEVAAELFDTAVNMGQDVPGKFLQRALNVFNRRESAYADIKVDGIIGPKTLQALREFVADRGEEGRDVLRKTLNGLQCAKYVELAENTVKNERFVYGWIRKRVQ